jgi:nucleotide-binding universal stress UspA family protein
MANLICIKDETYRRAHSGRQFGTVVPVLWGENMYKKILVPTDGSAVSATAAEAAIAFARTCGSELISLSIAPPEPVVLSAEGAIAGSAGLDVDVLLEQAQRYAEDVANLAARSGVKCMPLTGYGYSPADEIIETVKRHGCDLIFIASHGRRGLSRLIAGSVTQRVLAYAPVPVMVYRPQLEHDRGYAGGFGQTAPQPDAT